MIHMLHPLHLLYGDDAMTLTKLKRRSLRVQLPQTTGERELSLDLTKGTWLHAVGNLDHYITETKAWCNPKVVLRRFEPRDLVLQRALENYATNGKDPTWSSSPTGLAPTV